MQEQLRLLEELQRHDAKLVEFESALKTLPEKLEALKKDHAKVSALLEKERQSLAETEKFRRELEFQVKSDESNVAKSKSKLSQSKSGKDYMAAQREIESNRKMAGEREEELIRLMAAIETSKKSVVAHEKDVADLQALVVREEDATKAKLAELEQKFSGERGERDVIARKVRPDVLKKYGTIRMRRGLAVVPVVASSGACAGCHMAIPPQMINVLRRGTSMETCPHCNRIIYWPEIVADKVLERGEQH